jgi:hypothetical protein
MCNRTYKNRWLLFGKGFASSGKWSVGHRLRHLQWVRQANIWQARVPAGPLRSPTDRRHARLASMVAQRSSAVSEHGARPTWNQCVRSTASLRPCGTKPGSSDLVLSAVRPRASQRTRSSRQRSTRNQHVRSTASLRPCGVKPGSSDPVLSAVRSRVS